MRESEKIERFNVSFSIDHSSERWTVDEPEDYEVVKNIFECFSPKINFSWLDILSLVKENPTKYSTNKFISRNEGLKMGTGQKLWKRAQRVIPGGNNFLSKRPEMFLPEKWPAYFSKTRGCFVWDLDGNRYIDMSLMGVGTNVLGYSCTPVDQAVQNVIKAGNLSTLNCPEEVYLAEKLIEMHPWSSMVRFARTGGEANSISIRIARAATKNKKTAILFSGV